MEVTIHMGDATFWDALAAIGTLLAVITAVGIAATDRNRIARDGVSRAHSAVRLAERMSTLTHLLIEEAEKAAGDDRRISSHSCNMILRSGAMRELVSGFEQLRPAELPTEMTAQAYVGVRMNARDMIGVLERLAESPGSASTFDAPRFQRANGQHWTVLQDAVSRLSRGPISSKRWKLIKERREKEVMAAIKRDRPDK